MHKSDFASNFIRYREKPFLNIVKFEKVSFIGAALKCAPIMEWEFILASGRSSF